MPGPNAETQEDDGYLLGLVYNAAKHRTFLAVSLLCVTSCRCMGACSEKRKITPLGVITGASRPRGSPRLLP